MAMQADLLQRLPVIPKTNNPQQIKDKSCKDYLQAPKETLNALYDQQSTA